MGVEFNDESTGKSYEQYPKDPAAREQIAIVKNKVEELEGNIVSKQEIINVTSDINTLKTKVDDKASVQSVTTLTSQLAETVKEVNGAKPVNGKLTITIPEIDTSKLATKNELAEKAKQSDLEIERQRISNLTANAGNTDGNAELLDVRVGFDGVTYATAGEATRAIGSYMTEENKPWEVN